MLSRVIPLIFKNVKIYGSDAKHFGVVNLRAAKENSAKDYPGDTFDRSLHLCESGFNSKVFDKRL